MRLYFAGADAGAAYNSLLERHNAQNRLESFWTLGKNAPSTQFPNYLLDSGGFVARTKGTEISVESYAKFINLHKIRFAFNLDTNNVEETLANQKYLDKHTSAYILPIYHMSDFVSPKYRSLLNDFIKDYPFIAAGGMVGDYATTEGKRIFLDYVFRHTRDTTKVHGLGMTTRWLLERYPFYSVDSTSWLSTARYGNSISKDKLMTQMKSKTRHYLQNTDEEIGRWLEVQKTINELWAKRNITWD